LTVDSAAGDPAPVDQGLFLLHLNRARRGVREGRLEEAWEELEQARTMRPRDEDVLNLLSLLEFKRGHYNEAANAARTLLADNPTSEVLRANLGLILFKAGFLAESEL
jgi:Flp pilus assembly protein TadD